MASLYRMLCIVLLLHSSLWLTPTSAAYPRVLDIQIVGSALPPLQTKFDKCDANCEILKSFELESDIVRLSSLTVHTKSLWNIDWPLMELYKIIFTLMQLKYLRQPMIM